ncbi:MAG: hypothetical protein JW720_03330 [Sedimentisphaerales bacterium]|nr:hypothetical protein [Sedimentisphaerales bacterium]
MNNIINKIKGRLARSKSSGAPNKCKRVRTWLCEAVNSRFGLEAKWVHEHVAVCPKCSRRLAAIGRVNLAISAVKTQPHSTELLMHANTQAISVLKHSLRDAPGAQKLKKTLPRPGLMTMCRRYTHATTNLAACIAILVLMKVGIFSSIGDVQAGGQEAVEQYYAIHAGQDLADDIFTT